MSPGLNPQQAAAVRHRDGPLLVLAGAGTGKTRVVTERVASLLRSGVAPENVLAVTFTNKAAGEMRERLARLIGKRFDLAPLIMSTFHSLCVRLLRRDPEPLGYRPGFAICDRGEQLSLVRQAGRNVTGAAALSPEDLLERIGRYKTAGTLPETALRDAVEPEELTSAHVYRKYQATLKSRNTFDFDDLLGAAVNLLRRHPPALEHWRRRFHFVLVDEFQDTNAIQCELVDLLVQPRRNLCVVGDDDQSIYGWRGAVARNILDFHHRYPGAAIVTLEENYRSVNTILRAANAVIGNNRDRHVKTLRSALGEGEPLRVCDCPDQEEEARWIGNDLAGALARGDAKPGDTAILLRANAQARRLEDALRERRLAYTVIGGQSYYERKEVRDMLAFFALVAHPGDDNALRRVVNVPPRGLGEKSLEALEAAAAKARQPLSRFLAQPQEAGLTAKAAEAARHFAEQIAAWRQRVKDGRLGGLAKQIAADIGYEEEVNGLYDDPLRAAERYAQAQELDDALVAFAAREASAERDGDDPASPSPDGPAAEARPGRAMKWLSAFVQEAMLWGRSDETDKERERGDERIKIITGHSAKGLEFDTVYIPGVEESLWPHKNAEEGGTVDEERRLFYVALTRARRRLVLTHCRARVVRGQRLPRAVSRFLGEIPEELLSRESALLTPDEIDDWVAEMTGRTEDGEK